MSEPSRTVPSAEHWDQLYSGEPVWSGNPNAALIEETRHLSPGRVLDVGCGEGADTVWLAQQGWEVTALDVSAHAVERTLAAAAQAGLAADGVTSDLLEAPVETGSFDLVSAMFPALLRTPEHAAEHRLLDLVAPGGTLLVVHHADVDRDHALAHGCDPDDYVAPADVRSVAEETGGWRVITATRRTNDAATNASTHHQDEWVLRLQRG